MPAALPVLVGVSVAGTAASIYSSEKARKEQKKARKAQDRIRQTQSARDRLAQVRQARIAQAQVVQGEASMEGSSSASQGAYSAIGSTLAGNLQFMNQIDSLQTEVYNRMNKASLYGAQAGYYGQAANLAMQGASMGLGAPTKSPPMSQALTKGAQASTVGNASTTATTHYTASLPPSPFG